MDNRAQGDLMYFDTFAEFLQMGKHGLYVWLAYALTFLPVVVMVWLPVRRQRQHWRWIASEQRRADSVQADMTNK